MTDNGLFSLTGATAVVTGAAKGLGLAMARGLATHGARVVVADIDAEGAAAVAASLTDSGSEAHAFTVDTGSLSGIEALFRFVRDLWGSLDILVNNAGISVKGVPETISLDVWNNALLINTTSYLLTAQQAFPLMRAGGRHGGSIINVSSISGAAALGRGSVAYSTSKAAVNGLTRELAAEWGAYGIRVNSILPSQFMTPTLAAYMDSPEGEGIHDRYIRTLPLGRLGRAEEIAGPVVFLASEASSMVTGHLLAVDGGSLATSVTATVRPIVGSN